MVPGINNVRRASDNERRADRSDEFSAVKHDNNNNTNIHEQTTYATKYQLERRLERKLEAIEANSLHALAKKHDGLPFKTEEEKKDVAKILELWGEYSNGKTNIIYERYKFNNRQQKPDESIDAYATVLRDLASFCNNGPLNDASNPISPATNVWMFVELPKRLKHS